jgi:hypothetical protein
MSIGLWCRRGEEKKLGMARTKRSSTHGRYGVAKFESYEHFQDLSRC